MKKSISFFSNRLFRSPISDLSIGCVREPSEYDDPRISLVPETVFELLDSGGEFGFANVFIEKSLGEESLISDEEFREMGCTILDSFEEVIEKSDILLKINPPLPSEIELMPSPSVCVVGYLDDFVFFDHLISQMNEKGVNGVSLDRIPRTYETANIDVVSLKDDLIGHECVVQALSHFGRPFASQNHVVDGEIATYPQAKVLIVGATISGISAIMSSLRLGADVNVFDPFSSNDEFLKELGANVLSIQTEHPEENFDDVMNELYSHIVDHDILITSVFVPSERAPVLVPKEVVDKMKPGSVIVDLAAVNGGNVETTEPTRTFRYMLNHEDHDEEDDDDDLENIEYITHIGELDLSKQDAESFSKYYSALVLRALKMCCVEEGEEDGQKYIDLTKKDSFIEEALFTDGYEGLIDEQDIEIRRGLGFR